MRGKLTIIAILIVALTAASFAWWWRATSQRRVREFWGISAQQTISFARRVEAFKLPDTDAETDQTLAERVQQIPPEAFIDISHAPGLIHAKHSLMEEASFAWEAPSISPANANWDYGVRFQNGETVTILFDFEHHRLVYVEANKVLTLIEKTSDDWKNYLDRRAFSEPPPESRR